MLPQEEDFNRFSWANLENYTRDLVQRVNEVYVIAGGYGSKETISRGRVNVPKRFWKIIVVLPSGNGDIRRINRNTRVIAVDMPNDDGIEREPWRKYLTTVDAIEEATGYDFLSNAGRPQASILIRLDAFLRQRLIRNIVCQKESRLNLRQIMDERKILLVKLSQGLIGTENAALLGTMLISKLYQIALSRQDVDAALRAPFWCYVDEAASFVNPSMAFILSSTRKYGVGLTLAAQNFKQFQTRDADLAAGILSNCYTRICFRLGDDDARRFADGFAFFTPEHLQNLGVGEAIARIERAEYAFNLKTLPVERVPRETAEKRTAAIIENTRRIYGKPKSNVETENTSNPLISVSNNLNRLPVQPASDGLDVEISPEIPQELQSSDIKINAETLNRKNSPKFAQPDQGRGGNHHQELQAVINRMAESCGFHVEIEKSVLNGGGSVNVSLENESLKIACEVSVTSTIDYETRNVLKCLAAGYDYAIVVVSNQKKLSSLEAKLRSEVPAREINKVKVFGLSNLLAFLRELTAPKDAAHRKPDKPAGQRLSFAEAYDFFGVTSSTLYRWVREGRVPFYRVGREYQFDRNELVLLGRHDLSGKRKASVKLEPLKIEKTTPKSKKEQSARYRKLLKLD